MPPIVPTFDPVPGQGLESSLSELLVKHGFEPGWPIYQHDEEYQGVSLDDLRVALFESAYTKPRILELQAKIPNPDPDQDIAFVPMLVETVTQVYVDLCGPDRTFAEPLRPREWPHFSVSGLLYNNSYHQDTRRVRMHAYLDVMTPEVINAIFIQLVVTSKTPRDLSVPLRWADVSPGELGDA